MTTVARAPVVVIGAGPVGLTAALLLARWGLDVVLLDARRTAEPVGSKAICQQRDVLDVWSAVGCGAIADEGLTWTTARTFHRDHELFAWSFVDPGRSPLPPFVNISQSRTEEILHAAVARSPSIDLRMGHEVTGLEQDACGVRLHCATPAGPVTVDAPYVIACCGSRAEPVRRALGVSFDGHSFDDRFLICDIRADLPGWEHERRFYFDPPWNPGRQVLIHPCPGSTYRIDWQVPPEFDLAAEEAGGGLDRRIRQIVGDRPYEVVWRSVYRFHSRRADRFAVGRVLLAGDLAHLVAPFGARGLNSGVQDAENAAWKIAYVARGWAPAGLLATYHDERSAAADENLDVTGATMRFLVPATEADRRARLDALERARHDPAAAGQVDSGRLAEPYWYVDSPLTTPQPARPFTGRPPRGGSPAPGPGVIVPDGPVRVPRRPEVTRLRQLARAGILLLTGDGVDPAEAAGTAGRAAAGPIRAFALRDIDTAGVIAQALGIGHREVWVVRPDAHVAAVLDAPGRDAVTAAVRRTLGHPVADIRPATDTTRGER